MLAHASLSEPVLLIDETRARRNIERMSDRAHQAGMRLRPHFKTHQSHAIGRWFREAGVSQITVSSLRMAEYFADDGWADITLAFPFHPGMHDRIEALAQRIRIAITVADACALDGVRFSTPLPAWIKLDVGAHRTGFDPGDPTGLMSVASALAAREDLRLIGLLAHAGQSYKARGEAEIREVHARSLGLMQRAAASLAPEAGRLEISLGDTPTCSRADDFAGVDEIRPGNFVFHDLSQWQIGACPIEDIAVAMACPVASCHPERGQIVVHGGAVHFSREAMAFEGGQIFGLGLDPTTSGWGGLRSDLRLRSLSQEHGVVEAPRKLVERTRPGNVLLFAPVHSCLTADAMQGYRGLDGSLITAMGKPG